MGVVYKAEDIKLKRTVALKFLPPEALKNEKERTRFVHEAQAEAALDHPNICAIHEIEEAEGHIFISMAHIEGQSLKERIESGPLTLEEALNIAIQVAGGLEEAHEKGITHRDIKPGNIMLTTKGQAKIMDFGLAKLSDATRVTKTGTTVGTLAFMSPEQVKGDTIDHRTDVWSLGVVLYELLTGQLPFRGDYEASLLYSIVNEEPAPASHINTSLPRELDDIIRKSLQKKVENRYSSMQEMLDDLKQIQWRISSETAREIAITGRKLRWVPLHKTTFILAAALVIVIVLFALMKYLYDRNGEIPDSKVDIAPVWIAVLDFENHTKEPDLGYVFARLLTTDLKQNQRVKVYEAGMGQKPYPEHSVRALTADFDFFREKGISFIISGNVKMGRNGDDIIIETTVYDVESDSRSPVYNKQFKCSEKDTIFSVVDAVANELRNELHFIPQGQDEIDREIAQLASNNFDAVVSYFRGMDEYYSGNQLTGVSEVKHAVVLDSTFVMACRRLAIWYDYLKDSENALKYAQQARRHSLIKGLSTLEQSYSAFIEHKVKKNWDEAKLDIDQLILLDPFNITWLVERGRIHYYHLGDHKQAISDYREVIKLDSLELFQSLGPSYNHLGHAYLYAGQLDNAMVAFQKYRDRIGHQNPDPIHSIGFAYQFMGQYAHAIEQYKKVIRMAPEFYVVYKDLGDTYLSIGKWKEAIREYEKYRFYEVQEGSGTEAHILLAMGYYIQDDVAKVEAEISKALKKNSNSIRGHWMCGLTALELGEDVERARAELGTLNKLTRRFDEKNERAYYFHLQGMIQLHEDDINGGLASLQEAAEISPRDFLFFGRELVRGYVKAGRYDKAIDKAGYLLDTFNQYDAELHYQMGRAFEEKGERDEAEHSYNRALKIWKEADDGFIPLERLTSKLKELS